MGINLIGYIAFPRINFTLIVKAFAKIRDELVNDLEINKHREHDPTWRDRAKRSNFYALA